jgi:hypothetical protein
MSFADLTSDLSKVKVDMKTPPPPPPDHYPWFFLWRGKRRRTSC